MDVFVASSMSSIALRASSNLGSTWLCISDIAILSSPLTAAARTSRDHDTP